MKTCNYCEKNYNSIYQTSKFCSLSCANYYREATKAVKFKFCKTCNKSFKSQGEGRSLKVFCSHSCAATTHNRKRKKIKPVKLTKHEQDIIFIEQWKLGIVDGGNKHNVRAQVKRYLLEESKYECSMCKFSGVNSKTGRTILQIDHIDGNCKNNSYGNLRVLCPNCHAQTPTFGALNKNSGRAWKRHTAIS